MIRELDLESVAVSGGTAQWIDSTRNYVQSIPGRFRDCSKQYGEAAMQLVSNTRNYVESIPGRLKSLPEQHRKVIIAFGIGVLRTAGTPTAPLAIFAGLIYAASESC